MHFLESGGSRPRPYLIVAGAGAAIILAVLTVLMALQSGLTADGLYCLDFVDDLLFGAVPFHWMAPGPNFLVPDMLIVLVARLLGFDGQANFIFFDVCFALLLYGSLVLVLHRCRLSLALSLLGAFIATSIFCFPGAVPYSIYPPALHQGIIPLIAFSFVALADALGDRKTMWPAATTASVLIALAVASDAIAVVQLVVPAIVALVCLYWRGLCRRALYVCAAFIVAASTVGMGLQKLVSSTDMMHQQPLGQALRFDAVPHAIAIFFTSFPNMLLMLGAPLFWVWVIGLFAACAILVVAFFFPRVEFHQSTLFCVVALAASVLTSLLAPVAAGTYVSTALFREQLPSLLFGTALLAWIILSVSPRPAWVGSLLAVLVLLPFARGTYMRVKAGTFPRPFLAGYERAAQELHARGFDFIFADYWDTKTLTTASSNTLHVCQSLSNFSMYGWMVNLSWCSRTYAAWSAKRVPLVLIVQPGDMPPSVQKENGKSLEKLTFPGLTMQGFVYPWTPELDRKIRTSICNAFSSNSFPAPSFCR